MRVQGGTLLVAALLSVLHFRSASAQLSNTATRWLYAAQQTVAAVGIENQASGRLYGLVGASQYKAIVEAEKRGWSLDAAAALASHAALSYTAYWRQSNFYDPLLRTQLAALNVSDSTVLAIQKVVNPIVLALVKERLSDHSSEFSLWRPAAPGSIGVYQYTPGQTTVRYPQVANATGYYLTQPELDTVTATYKHHSLNSSAYLAELKQSFSVGFNTSAVRTPEQSAAALFYALGAGTSSIAGWYVNVTYLVLPSNFTLKQTARFYQLLGSSIWDAGIACFKVKYREVFWRPITAIRTPHNAGPKDTPAPYDPTWTPFLPTPAHPEYPSGHTCTAGAAVYLLQRLLGDATNFTLGSEGTPDQAPHTYTSFEDTGVAVANSRLWGGIHLAKSNNDGLKLGRAVASKILREDFGNTFTA